MRLKDLGTAAGLKHTVVESAAAICRRPSLAGLLLTLALTGFAVALAVAKHPATLLLLAHVLDALGVPPP